MPRPHGSAGAPTDVPATTSGAALLHAVDELAGLAPDLGWSEASGVTEALLDGLAHRLADAATDREEPRPLPLVVGAIGEPDRPPDHASCRAASARLRALSPLLTADPRPWASEGGTIMVELGDLLDHLAERTRRAALTGSDKGVVLRRLHALQRRLRG